MNINKTVQTEISTRFGGGEIFTTYNFADLEKLLCCKPSSIRNALFYLRADAKFITLKYRAATAQSNKQLVNHYQIAKFDKQDLVVPVDYPPGSLTVWHPMIAAMQPHYPGHYDIRRVGSEEAERREWDGKGWGNLPTVFVMMWRGVTR